MVAEPAPDVAGGRQRSANAATSFSATWAAPGTR